MDLAERSVMYHTRNKAGEFVKESVFEYGQVTRERKTQGFLRLRQGVLSQMQSYHQVSPTARLCLQFFSQHSRLYIWFLLVLANNISWNLVPEGGGAVQDAELPPGASSSLMM